MSQRLSTNSPVAVTVSTSIGFVMMCVGMFMAILDVQVVATSLPTIQGALAIPPDQMSWVQTAYLIAEVIAIPLTGFLTRALSMRWLFVLAISVFTLASLGCAASDSFAVLIAWRVLQGFSGGTLIPSCLLGGILAFPRCGGRALRPHSPACWQCSRRPLVRSSAAGLQRPIPGTGYF